MLVPGSALAAQAAPAPRFRGTSDGQILVTTNDGATWTLHADFGKAFSVLNIQTVGTDTIALLQYKGLDFKLKLSVDGKHWVTP